MKEIIKTQKKSKTQLIFVLFFFLAAFLKGFVRKERDQDILQCTKNQKWKLKKLYRIENTKRLDKCTKIDKHFQEQFPKYLTGSTLNASVQSK